MCVTVGNLLVGIETDIILVHGVKWKHSSCQLHVHYVQRDCKQLSPGPPLYFTCTVPVTKVQMYCTGRTQGSYSGCLYHAYATVPKDANVYLTWPVLYLGHAISQQWRACSVKQCMYDPSSAVSFGFYCFSSPKCPTEFFFIIDRSDQKHHLCKYLVLSCLVLIYSRHFRAKLYFNINNMVAIFNVPRW